MSGFEHFECDEFKIYHCTIWEKKQINLKMQLTMASVERNDGQNIGSLNSIQGICATAELRNVKVILGLSQTPEHFPK